MPQDPTNSFPWVHLNPSDGYSRPPVVCHSGRDPRGALLLLSRARDACMPPRMTEITGTLQGPQLEALVELLYLAASADGDFSADERQLFVHKVFKLTGDRLTSDALESAISRVVADVERDGREQRITSVRDRLENDGARHAALLMAIDMTMADEVLRTSEREMIADMAEGLGIERDVAADYIARMSRQA